MNKTLLATTLLALLSGTSFAENPTTLGNTPQTSPPSSSLPAPSLSEPSNSPTATPNTQQPIDCKYSLPAQTTHVDNSLISTWAGKAAVQSFNFDPASLEGALANLKTCYTDQGWQSFNDALEKSGNIKAIKSQHLSVSSLVDGDVQVNPVKDNQWKATVPLQVVYQNDKEKLTQLLTVDLLIGRKVSGDLGIMQMIASPRQTGGEQHPASGETSTSGEATKASPSDAGTSSDSTTPAPGSSSNGSQQPNPGSTQEQKPIPASQTEP